MPQRKRSRGKRSLTRQSKHRKVHANKSGAPSPVVGQKFPVDWGRFRSQSLPLLILVLVTLVAFANSWPNNLVFDDTEFAVSQRFLALGPADVARFFTEDLWAVNGVDSGLYRPLLLLSILIDAHLFGNWAAGYHLINILLHVLATVLVYGLIRHLLLVCGGQLPSSGYIAIMAALIFGVHPIHTEVVNSIFNRSELLVTLGIAGGLLWFLKARESHPRKAWFGLSVVYLVVLLSRESGIMLPALAVALLLLTVSGTLLERIRQCLPVFLLLIPLAFYFGLRANALEDSVSLDEIAMFDVAETANEREEAVEEEEIRDEEADDLAVLAAKQIVKMSRMFDHLLRFDREKWSNSIKLTAESLKIMVWPYPLLIYHDSPEIELWTAVLLQSLLIGAALAAYLNNRPGLLIGLAFFYIAMLPSVGIVSGAKPPLLAERFLYLPSTGLAIALAFGLNWLTSIFNWRTALVPVVVITLLLTPLTWARNAEWASDILLAEADYRRGSQERRILQALVEAHIKGRNIIRAVEICDNHPDALHKIWYFSNKCGAAYYQAGQIEKAEQAYEFAMGRWHHGLSMVHYDLAVMYLQLGRTDDAKKHFEKATDLEKNPFLKEFRIALMLIQVYPSDRIKLLEARNHLEKALDIQPQSFQVRQVLNQINKALGY